MSVNLSHGDALRLASEAGAFLAALYGTPDIVIGIENGGTAVAAEFARSAAARECTLIRQRRPTSSGWRGRARALLRTVIPVALRQLYRRLFFRMVASASQRVRVNHASLDPSAMEKLREILHERDHRFVVIADDAIDTGLTSASVTATIRALLPDATIMLFALTSTTGQRVTPLQVNVFMEVVEYDEGDIADLATSYRDKASWSRPEAQACPRDLPGDATRTLFLDLDAALRTNALTLARRELLRYLMREHCWRMVRTLLAASVSRALRLTGRGRLKIVIDALIRDLDAGQRAAFQAQLSEAFVKASRWTLVEIAKSPGTRGRIVTAAPATFTEAIEAGLGLPVVVASGPDDKKVWREIDSAGKVAAMRADLAANNAIQRPAIYMGDAISDTLIAADGIHAIALPRRDKTGLATLLAVKGRWRDGTVERRSA